MHFINGKIQPRVSRRDFLKGGAAAAAAPLVIGLDASGNVAAASSAEGLVSDFVHVTADDRVIVIVKHVEAGQGPATGLATLVAEEMDADWDKVEAVFAPVDNARYANLAFGLQGTGGSTAIANSFLQYRGAGALALSRLKAAAAAKWGVDEAGITAKDGVLSAGGNSASFGELAKDAGAISLPPDTQPQLKPYEEFSFIGRDGDARLPRKDLKGKTTGEAMYAMDYRPDDLLYVVHVRSPRFGGALSSFDDSEAAKVNGFVAAKAVPIGVAVYAESQWAAIKASRAIKAQWDFSAAENRSSEQMFADYWKAIETPGHVAANTGDAASALSGAERKISVDFEFPFLAHAPMEPLNCVMQVRDDGGVTMWDGCQFPGATQGAIAAVFELPPEKVEIVTMFAGGTFGRRATPTSDYHLEAAVALKASPAPMRPHKVMWTREEDIRGGYYRPMYVHRGQASLDANGGIGAWRHDLAGKSILIGTPFGQFVQNNIDNSSVEGISNLAYSTPNLHVEIRNMQESAVPVLWWRSVGHTHTAYASEVMVDMLAEEAGEDLVDFRLRHLGGHPRHAGVLKAVAELADWGRERPGIHRGVAVHESFSSFVAQVVDISLNDRGAVKVEKVYCAVDCGIAVNPDVVRAQMESGIGFGLGHAMRNEVTLKDGEVVQSNFPDYEPLRMRDMPDVETVIVKSREMPTGVGEPGVPPVAPALAGAIYSATGNRITKLPMTKSGVTFA